MGEKQAEKNEREKKGDGVADKKDDGNVTVVLKLDMHCEGCAKKVRRSVKNFDGVESVKVDSANNKLTVIGKVDPVKIKERVEEKTKKKVELVSPQPKKDKEGGGGDGGDGKKADAKSEKKSDEDKKAGEKKSKEPQVSTVVLKTRVHCEGCAQKIKKILMKCDGVQDVNVDLQKDQITVKGTMNMKELLPYLNTKLKRAVEIAPAAKKDDGGAADKKKEGSGGDKKEGGGEKKDKKGGGEKDKESGGGDKKGKEGGCGDKDADAKPAAGGSGDGGKSEENAPKIEVNKMEYYGYPYSHNSHTYYPSQGYGNGYVVEYMHAPEYLQAPSYVHAPQMFSDENPNACSIM